MWKFIKYFIWFAILVLIGYFLLFLKPATFLPNDDRVAPLTETAQEREDARQEAIENIPDVSDSFIDPSSDASGVFTPQEIIIPDDWVTYTNEEIGFEFSYPPEYGEVVYDRETHKWYLENSASTIMDKNIVDDYARGTVRENAKFYFETFDTHSAQEKLEEHERTTSPLQGYDRNTLVKENADLEKVVGYIVGRDIAWRDDFLSHQEIDTTGGFYVFNLESDEYQTIMFVADIPEWQLLLKSFQNISSQQSAVIFSEENLTLRMKEVENRVLNIFSDPMTQTNAPQVGFRKEIVTRINELIQKYKAGDNQSELIKISDEAAKHVDEWDGNVMDAPDWHEFIVRSTRWCVLDRIVRVQDNFIEECAFGGDVSPENASWSTISSFGGYYETLPYMMEGIAMYRTEEYARSRYSFNQVIQHYQILPEDSREFAGDDYFSNLQLANDMIAHIENF